MKPWNVLLLLSFCLTFATAPSAKEPTTPVSSSIIKSKNDTRNYETFTFKNGMEVLLASDANLSQTAVSLTVGVGQYQDPLAQPGLAHYLEHMIFMGSKKYPEPDALMKLVKANNGFINAMTEAQQTTFYLKVANNKFEQALSMLSAAIQAPLFKQSFAKKELNAINAEWSAAKESDGFAMQRVNALTSAKNHPMHHLGIGNLATLKDKKNSNLQTELKAFYQKYYSPNIMKLAIVGNKSLPELTILAKKYFAKMRNKHVARPITKVASFTKDNVQKQIFLQTKVQTDSLVLQFPLANNSKAWLNKPNAFVQYMLSSEEEGALVPTLRDAGLIDAMQVSINPRAYGADGVMQVYFVLTDKGKNKKNQIISAFFNYVNLIKNQGVTASYAQALQAILKNQFDNFQNPDALALAATFSRQMLAIPVVDILHYASYFPKFDKSSIQQVLAQITPQKLRLWHISHNEKTDVKLKYAKGSYSVKTISTAQLAQWQQHKFALVLPKAAVIDSTTEEVVIRGKLKHPKKIIDNSGVQAWLMHSQYFDNNQGITAVTLQSPLFQQDVKHHVMTNILLTALAKKLQRIVKRASQRDQVYIGGSQNKFGDLAFSFAGKASKQVKYVEKLFQALKNVEIKQTDFKRALKLYTQSTNNVNEAPLKAQAGYYFNIVTKTPPFMWSTDDKLQAAKSVSLSELKQFYQNILDHSYVDIFAFGHYDQGNVKQIANTVRTLLGKNNAVQKSNHIALYKPKASTLLNKKVEIKQENVMLKDTYIYPKISRKISTQLQLLNKLFESSFFKALRTKKQLAYEIGSYQEDVNQYPAFSLYIQSDNTDLQALKEYFMSFMFQFYKALKATDEAVFTQIRKNMINSIKQKPENVYVESKRYFIDWLEQRNNYDTNEKIISILTATRKKDLLNLYNDMLLNGQSANVMIQLRGTKFKEKPFFNWNNIAKN